MLKQYTPPTSHGFSLVELSIVLVILGLLTGGILGGQSLIKAAEMRAITTEYQQWQTAVNTFQDKYFALPGDMTNATSFWPGVTANGNGDGRVGPGGASAPNQREAFLFWQHLVLGGFITGQYTGNIGSGGTTSPWAPGENMPLSKFGSATWFSDYFDNATDNAAEYFRVNYKNGFEFWSSSPTSNPLTPEEAWNIDTKIDDGKPGQGSVYAFIIHASANSCTTAANNTSFNADYRLNVKQSVCNLYFADAF